MSVRDAAYDRVCFALSRAGSTSRNGTWTCPAHDDRNPSLSVTQGPDRALLKCFAGCTNEDICRALGLELADLFDKPRTNGHGERREILRTHDYVDAEGRLLFQTVRFDTTDKSERFRQRRPDGRGGWIYNLHGVEPVLYNLPEVLQAIAKGVPVSVAEGEHDADALNRAGAIATTNPMGAANWKASHTRVLAGAEVYLFADRDDTGRKRAVTLRSQLEAAGCNVKAVLEPVKGKDAAEVLGMGYTVDDGFQHADLDELDQLETGRIDARPSEDTDGEEGASPPVLPDSFWSERACLTAIRQAARARMVAPDAVLGAVLARVAARTSWRFVLPPVVGGYGSLNVLEVLVGESGSGKGGADAVANELYPRDPNAKVGEGPLGSGEGMVGVFFRLHESGGVKEHIRQYDGYLIKIDEGQMLTSLGSRQGQTTMETLRLAFSGERLGGNYVSNPWRVLQAHCYRLAVLMAIQPTLARALLDDAPGGTPQRFAWFSAVDPTAPDQPPPFPELTTWSPPALLPLDEYRVPVMFNGEWFDVLDVPDGVQATIRRSRLEVVRGTRQQDPLDGHRDLVRLKIAAGLAILECREREHGRLQVTADDWELAGTVIDTSDAVRGSILAKIRADAARKEIGHNARAATRAQAEESAKRSVNDKITRVARTIARRLPDDGSTVPLRDLSRAVASRDRDWFDAALTHAEAAGWVVETEDGRYCRGVSQPAA